MKSQLLKIIGFLILLMGMQISVAHAAGLFGITGGTPLSHFDRATLRGGTLYDILVAPERIAGLYAYAVQVNAQQRVCMVQAQSSPITIGKDGAAIRAKVEDLLPALTDRFGPPALGRGIMIDRNSAWLESFVDRLKSGKNALGAEWSTSRGHPLTDNLSEVLIFATPQNSRNAVVVVQGWFGDRAEC